MCTCIEFRAKLSLEKSDIFLNSEYFEILRSSDKFVDYKIKKKNSYYLSIIVDQIVRYPSRP